MFDLDDPVEMKAGIDFLTALKSSSHKARRTTLEIDDDFWQTLSVDALDLMLWSAKHPGNRIGNNSVDERNARARLDWDDHAAQLQELGLFKRYYRMSPGYLEALYELMREDLQNNEIKANNSTKRGPISSYEASDTLDKCLAQPPAIMMTDGKTVALCALALVGGLDLASAFQTAPSMPGPLEAAASSQLPPRIRRASEPCVLSPAINQHRSAVSKTTESLQAAFKRAPGLLPPLPRIAPTPPLVVSTDAAGFSSIPIGAPRAGHRKVAPRASRLDGEVAPRASRLDGEHAPTKPLRSPSTDSMGFCWIPVGGAAKHA
ncbi:hypothetical protein T484DRAFT_1806798 [Baffinella frigidus]|nr:hypothetical protein T484DRAFT_1806798 [Cryptophyta sp. CCMP2293]